MNAAGAAAARCWPSVRSRSGGNRSAHRGLDRLATGHSHDGRASSGAHFPGRSGRSDDRNYISGRLRVPYDPFLNALVRCCADQPETLLPHLRRSSGESRELLARVTSEMATPGMANEMLHLSEDPEPEVWACAARGLAVAPLSLAIPALTTLCVTKSGSCGCARSRRSTKFLIRA